MKEPNQRINERIDSWKAYKEYIEADTKYGKPAGIKQKIVFCFSQNPLHVIHKYMTYLRKEEYYINTAHGNKIKGCLGIYYEKKKNRLGNCLGIEISPNCFGKGLTIFHPGSVIVNANAEIGENCKLHGSNCIGNNGLSEKVPRIGNNVDVGFGAVIIGDVYIADNTIIGANSVVNKSIPVSGCTVAGVPAKVIKTNMVEKS